MDDVLIAQATDILQATLPDFKKNRCVMTYAYSNYPLIKYFWKDRARSAGGDCLEGYITLEDEGNAGHRNRWSEDRHNVVNTDQKWTVNWCTLSSNFSVNVIEMAMNKGGAQIYDKYQNKYNNTVREMADSLYVAIPNAPTSSTDEDHPHGLSVWLSEGTDASTGGWNGYYGHYNDGSDPGTTYNPGGLNAYTYTRWASYYADHGGDIDDSLLVLLDRATRKLNFQPPELGAANLPASLPNFTMYSNDLIVGSLNLLYAKSDDQMGYRVHLDTHFGVPHFKGVPIYYVSLFDTANTSTYGTNPIFGVNHGLLYPVVLNEFDLKIHPPRQRDNAHLQLTVDMDIVYAIVCEDRQKAGFLISS